MSITTKLFPHSLIGIVSVLPALLVMPASAETIKVSSSTEFSSAIDNLDATEIILQKNLSNGLWFFNGHPFKQSAITVSGDGQYTLSSLTGYGFKLDETVSPQTITIKDITLSGLNSRNPLIAAFDGAEGKTINFDNVNVVSNKTMHSTGAAVIQIDASDHEVNSIGIEDSVFSKNHSTDVGVIGQFGNADIRSSVFSENYTDKAVAKNNAGALFLGAVSVTNIDDTIFSSNVSKSSGGAIGTRDFSKGNDESAKLDISGAMFSSNVAATTGGAIDNYLYNDANGDGYVKITGSEFTGNTADMGGAIYNHIGQDGEILSGGNQQVGSMYFADSNFTGNSATTSGGAIYNEGVVTVAANAVDVVFSGNTANSVANDIYNAGTLNLTAAAGKKIVLKGGIDGEGGLLNVNGNGTVDVANGLKNHTVIVSNGGELWLSNGAADGSNLTGSTIGVNSGATLNLIDNKINNYSGITLANGASIKADFSLGDELKDVFAADGDFTLAGFGITSDAVGSTKTISGLTTGNVSVLAGLQAYTTNARYTVDETLEAGKIVFTKHDGEGGLKAAASDTSGGQVVYSVTGADASISGTNVNIAADDLLVKGNGFDGDAVDLSTDLKVAETKVLTIEDAKFTGEGSLINENEMAISGSNIAVDITNTGDATITETKLAENKTIENQANATLAIFNSEIRSTLNNAGTLISDPTDYYATVNNSGTASFDGDIFHDSAVFNNTGTADFVNGVTFDTGATITGAGLINLASGTTHFNNTASNNTLKLASGAKFDGTLASTGVLDTRNSNIDTGLGTVTGGDLYVDADLTKTSNNVDAFEGTSGANIKGIKIANTGYGTKNTVSLAVGGAVLDSDVDIEGINYYTSVVKEGDNIVFSDKLINESNLDTKLGSWTGGHYIKANTSRTAGSDADHFTVGKALKALDTQVYANETAIAGRSLIAGGNAFTGAQTITNTSDVADAVVSGITVTASNTTDSKSNVFAVTSDAVTVNGNAVLTTASALNGANLTAGSVGTDALAANIVTNSKIADDAVTLDKIADAAMVQGTGDYATSTQLTSKGYVDQALATSALNGANLTAGSVGTDALAANIVTNAKIADDAVTLDKIADAAMVQGTGDYATSTQLTSKGYVDQALAVKASVTALSDVSDRVTTLESAGYQTATQVNTAISNAIAANGVVGEAIDDKIAAAVENNGTVATAIQTATKMGAIDGNNYDANDSVVAAIEAIDTNVGKVHGLVTNDNDGVTRIHGTRTSGDYVAKNVDANTGAYTGNLAIGTTIEDHLISLDNTIGSMSTLDTSNGVLDNTASVAQNLQNLDTALANIRAGSLADANAYTDRRVESLDKNLSSGVAGAVALSSVAVSGVERGEVSVGAGYGYFNGQSAAAFGAAMGLSNRWSVNAGAGISNADVSFRAGTNYKFKLF